MTTTTTMREAPAASLGVEALRQKNLDEVVMSPWQNSFNESDEVLAIIEDACTYPSSAPDRRISPDGREINTIPHLGEGALAYVYRPMVGPDGATPRLADEFTCPSCFLHVRKDRATVVDGTTVCNDCGGMI